MERDQSYASEPNLAGAAPDLPNPEPESLESYVLPTTKEILAELAEIRREVPVEGLQGKDLRLK